MSFLSHLSQPLLQGTYGVVYKARDTRNHNIVAMKKVQLQTLCSSLSKMAQADAADRATKVKEFKAVESSWTEIIKSLTDIKSPVSYDWSSEDTELPAEWLRLVVLSFAQKNMADFEATEVSRLQEYLKNRFGNNDIALKIREKAPESVELLMKGEFIATIYKDDEDGGVSYDLNMAILSEDLPNAA